MEKSCGIYLLNDKNELLIVHPTLGKAIGSWGIPKGKIEDGETHLETALRELKEETNLDINNPRIIQVLPDSVYKSKRKILYSFLIETNEFDSETKVECISFFDFKGKETAENDDFKWVNIHDSLLDVLLHEAQISNLNLIRELYK